MKSFKPKDGPDGPPSTGGGRNGESDFRGQKRTNQTHASTTDPDARLYRKGAGQGGGQGGEAVLHGAWSDGEPLGSFGRCLLRAWPAGTPSGSLPFT